MPVGFGLAEHAGDQVDVDLREAEAARRVVSAADLGRSMRAAVELEDAIVEVLDAEAEPRDTHRADRGKLGFGKRAGLAFERDLFGVVPRPVGIEPPDQPL